MIGEGEGEGKRGSLEDLLSSKVFKTKNVCDLKRFSTLGVIVQTGLF